MRQQKPKRMLAVLGVVTLGLVLVAPAWSVAAEVAPGEVVSFSMADGGKKQCRYFSLFLDVPVLDFLCGAPPWIMQIPPWTFTHYNPGFNRAAAAYSNIYVPDLTNVAFASHYTSSGVYNEFSISDPDSSGHFVDAQITVVFNLHGGILGGLAYDTEMSAGLAIEDVTDPNAPVAVGAGELFKKDRSGDQGLTDIAFGTTQVSLQGETAHLLVKLRRGRTYRVWFGVQAFAATPLISGAEVSVDAHWTELRVGIDEDESLADLLARHDEEIKAAIIDHDAGIEASIGAHDMKMEVAIADHDLRIGAALASHDQEIKALLTQMQGELAEIKQLLLTPQGRREGFPQKPAKPN